MLKIVTYIIIHHETSQGISQIHVTDWDALLAIRHFELHKVEHVEQFFDMFKLIVLCNHVTINCDGLRCLQHNIQ